MFVPNCSGFFGSHSQDVVYTSCVIVSQPDRVLLERQIAMHAPQLKGRLLDIGSGGCRRYKTLCTNVSVYETLDSDANWKPDIVGSAEDIPLADASVDSVLCTQVLEHVSHPAKAVQEMSRVLKPGGLCLLTVPQENELHEEPHDYFRYTKYGLTTLLEEAGLKVEAMDQRGAYHAMMMQIRIRHLINTFKPYERKLAMLVLCPLSILLTQYALLRDRLVQSEAAKLHTIGWCVLAKKQ